MRKTIIPVVIILVLAACSGPASKESNTEEWTPLYNNKDLSGWDVQITGHTVNDNYKNTFRWEDSMLRVVYNDYDSFSNRFGHIYSHAAYSYYKLRFQYRFTGNSLKDAPGWAHKNSGAMLHSQSGASVNLNQAFPVSLEMQFLEGSREGENTTGNLCTPGTQVYMNGVPVQDHCTSSNSKKYTGDQWVDALVEV